MDEMFFNTSPRSSVGIEWELQMVDKDSNDMRQAASAVMDIIENSGAKHSNIHRELLLNTIEITSGARRTIGECLTDLQTNEDLLRPVTDPMRIDLATAGTHPFACPRYQRVTDSQRYADLVERTQYWGRQMLLYGLHVHVGIENKNKALPIIKALLTRFAHLQALSASSPFWGGEDTGYASNRVMYFQQLPTAGTPVQFDTWPQLNSYVQDMRHAGVISTFSEIRWDIRPAPHLGTIEIRVCDAPTNILEVGALAAFTQCLVEYFSRQLDDGKELPSLPPWFVYENKWRSARYGIDAELILDRIGTQEPADLGIQRILNQLEPISIDLGCHDQLRAIEVILHEKPAYLRMMEYSKANGGSLDAVVELMRAEMRARRPLSARERSQLRANSQQHP